MGKCIICGREIDEECEEHIIPYALGNKHFVIRTVCKSCNSFMGEKIDAENSNSFLAKSMRSQHGVKGRSKKLPNPFEEGETSDGCRVRLSQDLKPRLVPNVTRVENGYRIRASSREEALDIIEKIHLRRGKGPLTEEEKQTLCAQMQPAKTQPTIQFSVELNIEKFYLELIKIAFETLYYQEGEKILSEGSISNLQKILYDYLYRDRYDKELVEGTIGLLPENGEAGMGNFLSGVKNLFKDDVVHFVSVMSENNELIVMVAVGGMLNGAVKIPVTDSRKYQTKMYFICYPSGSVCVI